MRHYIAMQDAAGRWFYANEGIHRSTGERGWSPAGACNPKTTCKICDPYGFRGPAKPSADCEPCGGTGWVAKPDPCGGHDTEAEAYEHEKQRRLNEELEFNPDFETAKTQYRCDVPGCSRFTSGSAYVGPYKRWSLCAAHRTRAVVEPLLCVGQSWES